MNKVLISLLLISNIALCQTKTLLYFKDSYKMYLPNSYRFQQQTGFVQYGLYNEVLFDALIADGYIPVATADELNALRTTTTQYMGLDTPYYGEYLTGLDKKYVVYKPIDYGGNNFTGLSISGTFYGNEVLINNINCNINSLFDAVTGTIKDVLAETTATLAGLITSCTGADIDNCIVTTTINHTGGQNNVAGFCRSFNNTIITNCKAYGSATSNGSFTAGFTGGATNNSIIRACETLVNVECTSNTQYIGGFIGRLSDATVLIEKCEAHGNVTNTAATGGNTYGGGFIGYKTTGTLQNCRATGSVYLPNAGGIGGFIGQADSGVVTNCYSIGLVTGSTGVGGFAGRYIGTVTNCYYDTTTSGQSDTGKGVPKTTAEMQQGSIPDTAIYVGWDNTIWDAVDNNSYPELISLQ